MTKPPMSDWLVKKLMADGTITPDGIGRKARPRRCKKCQAVILAGYDHDTQCALARLVDPHALTPLGEALALVEGRYTVSLNHEGGRYVLNERYDLQIEAWPAGTIRREDILRQHRCNTPDPIGPLLAESTFPAARPTVTDIPPF